MRERSAKSGAVAVFVIGLSSLVLVGGREPMSGASMSQEVSPAPRTLVTVRSKDGTPIGVECAGAGPTVLFVHGGVGDRTRWTAMFPLLSSRFTTCAMDRRGRGASGDAPDYSLRREAEDVAAVVDSRPGPVYVFGHSFGGVVALEAAFLTNRISRLMLYEPPLHEPVDDNLAVAARLDTMIARGELEEALVVFQREIVKQTPDELAKMRTRSTWPALVASIAVHPRQMRALAAYRFESQRIRTLTVPTLLVTGGDTASPFAKQSIAALRAALPNARLHVLPGQGHNAMDAGREPLASAIVSFLDARQ